MWSGHKRRQPLSLKHGRGAFQRYSHEQCLHLCYGSFDQLVVLIDHNYFL